MTAERRYRASKLLIACGALSTSGMVARAKTNAEAIKIIRRLERRLAEMGAPTLKRARRARGVIERRPLVVLRRPAA